MKTMKSFLLMCLIAGELTAQTYNGDIVGQVIDGKTQEPLPAVNVQVIEQSTFGAVTDSAGNFIIKGIPVGTYSLKATIIGYETVVLTNIVVSTGRSTKAFIKLNEQAVEVSGVTVNANYFSRNAQLAPLSVNNYDRAEVKRQPGSLMDVQRVVQNLPGVASSNDNINELIVRGGAPYENLIVMENMEIPSINHYSNQFNSAGPINMVNIDLVEDVQFSSGGFPTQYGDKVSSVMDLAIREGDRNRTLASNTGFNMAGFGTLMEGRISEGRGSWVFSARKSFLEVIDKIIGMSAISLTAIPKYWDAQTKVVYDLSPTQKLTLNGLFGDSRIYIEGDPKEKSSKYRDTTISSSLQNVSSHNRQYVLGLNLKSLWGRKGYSSLTLYAVGSQYIVDVQENFNRRQYGPTGEVLNYSTLNSRDIFSNHSDEQYVAVKYDIFYQINLKHDLMLGAQIQTSNQWKNIVHIYSDSTRYFINGIWTDPPIKSPSGILENRLNFGDASKFFTYMSDKYKISPRLALTLGLRYDYFGFSKQGQFSPRASIAYEIFPPLTTISLAVGEYWQTQPFPNYGDPKNLWINKGLSNEKASHVVLGLQHILGDGIKLSVETYYKRFQNIAVSEEFVYSAIDTFRSDRNLAIGQRESYGMEFFLQKKQVTNYYGTLSVTLSKTDELDPRIPKQVNRYPSEYDYPVIFSLVAGKVVKGLRSWLDDQPFFIKYPSYIFPFSDEMEISFRFHYQTGGAYTPYRFDTLVQKGEAGVQWSKGAWVSSERINSERFPNYSRLDIQYLSRFYLKNWNINVYIALQNVFNTKNVFYYVHNSDGTRETVHQFTFFPVGGVEVEF
jgi:hypothetical protein